MNNKPDSAVPSTDPLAPAQALGGDFGAIWKSMAGLSLPAPAMLEMQQAYLAQSAALWNQSLQAPAAPPADRRFAAAEWTSQPGSAYLAQMYLLNARTLRQMADSIEGDPKTRDRIRFAVQQWTDAAAPSNYLALNPEAQRKALDTHGESIALGMKHLLDDVRQGHVSQTDESVFEDRPQRRDHRRFGRLRERVVPADRIQAADGRRSHARPMLFVPPCINKYYILDLQPENSLIRYTVEQGHRVFVVSWRNADDSIRTRTWDDYIEDAAIRAIEVVREITGSRQVNTLGFCVGGTILATALAVLAARGEQPAASMTLLTTFLDFSRTGVLDLFVDETMVQMRELTLGPASPGGGNLLKGQELATTFSFLRPNDLVWNYVVGNYLKGETPPPFDLLYWNSDGTNLPGPMYCWYLRNTYLENNLVEPDKATVCGATIDLKRVAAPTYVYASREDHIVPWEGAYQNTQVLGGKNRFVLGASGHIAGVINPPAKKKRSHWIGAGAAVPADPQDWLARATEHPGSWWTDWTLWLKPHGGKQVAAPRAPGHRKYPVIEAAPGRYVKQRAS